MNTSKPNAWLLLDDRPGHQTQVLGVGGALGSTNDIIPLAYNSRAKLPLGVGIGGLVKASKEALVPPYPDIAIAAGRKTVPIMRWLKRQSPSTFCVQLMWPGKLYDELDLVAVPEHDGRQEQDEKLFTTLGTPHALTHATLEDAKTDWQEELGEFEGKKVGVLLGGTSKYGTLKSEDAEAMAENINRYDSALITTSRRTPNDFVKALMQQITVPHYLYLYNWEGTNPYYGILAHADELLVTGDSMSMLCEAYYTGKPVEIFDTEGLSGPKHRRLHTTLRELDGPLDEAARIAKYILERQ